MKTKELNEKIALFATKWFGSMTMFWFFFIWALLPFAPWLVGAKDAILYVSAGIIQLVALPLLMVGQNLSGRAAEERAQADHVMITDEFALLKDMHTDLMAELQANQLQTNQEALMQKQLDVLLKRLDDQDKHMHDLLAQHQNPQK